MLPPPRHSRAAENKILAALEREMAPDFFTRLERVSMNRGEVVYEADSRIDYVYFPETAVFSMLCTMRDGRTVEVGPVGDEGMAGLRVFLGADDTPDRVIVHVAGSAMRLKADALREALRDGPRALPGKLLRYTQMLLTMTGRSAACNKLHSLEQQLARWLLTMGDYTSDEMYLTHELISLTLGVRRPGVTEASRAFKEAGVIDYRRGNIRIVDRMRLEEVACECYAVIKGEYQRLYADLATPQR